MYSAIYDDDVIKQCLLNTDIESLSLQTLLEKAGDVRRGIF